MANKKRLIAQQRAFDRLILFGLVAASLLWMITLLDHFFVLGWGWDVEGLWALPFIAAVSATLRFFGRAIFRFVDQHYEHPLSPVRREPRNTPPDSPQPVAHACVTVAHCISGTKAPKPAAAMAPTEWFRIAD